MRSLLILVLMVIGGICWAYSSDIESQLILALLIGGMLYAIRRIKPNAMWLGFAGLSAGVILSANYQHLNFNNKYYVNAMFQKSVGIVDHFVTSNRILSISDDDHERFSENGSPILPGTVVQMTGVFRKTPYALSGVLFEGEGIQLRELPTRTLRFRLESWKRDMAQEMRSVLGAENGALAASLVLGISDDLLKARRTRLKYLGILHILSISGFHVNLLEMMLDRIGLKRSSFPIIACYALLINSVSAWRACLMRLARLTGNFFSRDCDGLNQLLLSALILLTMKPYLIFAPGFQLTYLATLGLIILPGPIREWSLRIPRGRLKEGMILSTSAMIPCIPVLSRMSFDVNLALFPSNLILVPLYSLFCMVSFFCLPLLAIRLRFPGSLLRHVLNVLLRGIYFFEYLLSEYFSLRIAWSGILNFLWLPVFYLLLKKHLVSSGRMTVCMVLFYGMLFQLAFLPGTTRIIFHKQMGQASVVIQEDLRQYELVTHRMFRPSIRAWAVSVDEPMKTGRITVSPGTVFPQVRAGDLEILPCADPASDIIDEEYLLIFGKLIRLK